MAELSRRDRFLEKLGKEKEDKVREQFNFEWPKIDQNITEMEEEVRTLVLNGENISPASLVITHRLTEGILPATIQKLQGDVISYGYPCDIVQDSEGYFLKIFWEKE